MQDLQGGHCMLPAQESRKFFQIRNNWYAVPVGLSLRAFQNERHLATQLAKRQQVVGVVIDKQNLMCLLAERLQHQTVLLLAGFAFVVVEPDIENMLKNIEIKSN